MTSAISNDSTRVRAIAFYLPQFHPIPENDAWWGKGFTEWTNVTRARPLFPGHYQPHLPADLGFYDLRLPETRQAQADLAREYGIYGFCYYHYWFHGRRLLDRPVADLLQSGKPDFPFCLCWANENWTRAWDGHVNQILLQQTYSPEDDLQHIRFLAEVFRDPRYIRVHGKPLMLVYRAGQLPNVRATTSLWRAEAQRLGIDGLYLCCVESLSHEKISPSEGGFDAAVEFQPDWHHFSNRLGPVVTLWQRVLRRLRMYSPTTPYKAYNYAEVVKRMKAKPMPSYRRFPCVTPSWDNTARRAQDPIILVDSTPEEYGGWLQHAIARTMDWPRQEQIVFINGWNEWAEGNHLEPDQQHGRAYLEATRKALLSSVRDQPLS